MRNESLNPQTFDFYSLRFDFCALGPFPFPRVLSANIFRGALGLALRRTAPEVYGLVFAPRSSSPGASGLTNPPRPFALRTRHLDGRTVEAGETFSVGINLFWTKEEFRSQVLKIFVQALSAMADSGFGPQRSRAHLFSNSPAPQFVSLGLAPSICAERIRIDFLSPTELKGEESGLDTPLFATLLGRARDRISTLRALYGSGPLLVDFAALTARASAIRLTSSDLHHVEAFRRSSRTGETHPLGGFVGCAEYAGSLREFLPYLEVAVHTGIGRQTVWGKGEIAIQDLTNLEEPAKTAW